MSITVFPNVLAHNPPKKLNLVSFPGVPIRRARSRPRQGLVFHGRHPLLPLLAANVSRRGDGRARGRAAGGHAVGGAELRAPTPTADAAGRSTGRRLVLRTETGDRNIGNVSSETGDSETVAALD